jgi:hypothetical protein
MLLPETSGHHRLRATGDPDQLVALRRLSAAFGFVLILEVPQRHDRVACLSLASLLHKGRELGFTLT